MRLIRMMSGRSLVRKIKTVKLHIETLVIYIIRVSEAPQAGGFSYPELAHEDVIEPALK